MDGRTIDLELATTLLNLESLKNFWVHRCCKISFELLHYLLAGLQDRRSVKPFVFYLDLWIYIGAIGVKYKDGAKPMIENDVLVPSEGWIKSV